MKKLIGFVAAVAAACVTVMGAGPTPIQNLQLVGNGNGEGNSFTNLNNVVVTGTVSIVNGTNVSVLTEQMVATLAGTASTGSLVVLYAKTPTNDVPSTQVATVGYVDLSKDYQTNQTSYVVYVDRNSVTPYIDGSQLRPFTNLAAAFDFVAASTPTNSSYPRYVVQLAEGTYYLPYDYVWRTACAVRGIDLLSIASTNQSNQSATRIRQWADAGMTTVKPVNFTWTNKHDSGGWEVLHVANLSFPNGLTVTTTNEVAPANAINNWPSLFMYMHHVTMTSLIFEGRAPSKDVIYAYESSFSGTWRLSGTRHFFYDCRSYADLTVNDNGFGQGATNLSQLGFSQWDGKADFMSGWYRCNIGANIAWTQARTNGPRRGFVYLSGCTLDADFDYPVFTATGSNVVFADSSALSYGFSMRGRTNELLPTKVSTNYSFAANTPCGLWLTDYANFLGYIPGSGSSLTSATVSAALEEIGGRSVTNGQTAVTFGSVTTKTEIVAIGAADVVTPTSWASAPALPAARYALAAAVLNGQMYAIGGAAAANTNSVYAFDGTNWTTITNLPASRSGMAAVTFNGKVYSIAGNAAAGTTNVYSFDGTNWAEVAGLPAARGNLAAAVLGNYVYAMGGILSGSVKSNTYAFDGTNWTTSVNFPVAKYNIAATTLGGKLYVVGGQNAGGSPTTNVYSFDGTNWVEVAGLPAARHGVTALTLGSTMYSIGGFNSTAQTNVYAFDGTNWTEITGLPLGRYLAGGAVFNGKMYNVGGWTTAATNDVRVYTLSTTATNYVQTWKDSASNTLMRVYTNALTPGTNGAFDVGASNLAFRTGYFGSVVVSGNPVLTNVPSYYLTNTPSFSPTGVSSTSSNVLSLSGGWLQQLALTNATTLYAPTSPDTGMVHGVRLELYVGTNSFTLGTNSMLIGTNNALGAGVTDFMARVQTNRYNAMIFDKGVGETYFRVFGLNF